MLITSTSHIPRYNIQVTIGFESVSFTCAMCTVCIAAVSYFYFIILIAMSHSLLTKAVPGGPQVILGLIKRASSQRSSSRVSDKPLLHDAQQNATLGALGIIQSQRPQSFSETRPAHTRPRDELILLPVVVLDFDAHER